MKKRADVLLESGGLTVRLTSPEDIFLFKSVAGRSTDIDDMNTLVQAGLDFETVEREIEDQAELLKEDLFVTHIAETLAELRERHGVTTSLSDYVERRSEEVYEQLEILMAIKEEGPLPTDVLVKKTEVEEEYLDERLDRLEELGRIREIDGSWTTL